MRLPPCDWSVCSIPGLWLVDTGSHLGCRVTRVMLIITVGSQTEFVIVTLTRGRHGKWEGNSSDIPHILNDYFHSSHVTQCFSGIYFSIHPASHYWCTPGKYLIFVEGNISHSRPIMRTRSSVITPPPLWRWYRDPEGGCQGQPIRCQDCDSVTNEMPGCLSRDAQRDSEHRCLPT